MTIKTGYEIGKDAYANYKGWKYNPLRCITHLIENNELIWKILKYNDPDAWKEESDGGHPNLSHAEKAEMIYDGFGDMTKFNVYPDIGQDESYTNQKTLLRITNYKIVPKNRTRGIVTIIFEVYSHAQINIMSDRTTRVDTIMEELLDVFNGKDIEGIGLGKLFFDSAAVAENRLEVGGQIPFRGKWALLSNNAGG